MERSRCPSFYFCTILASLFSWCEIGKSFQKVLFLASGRMLLYLFLWMGSSLPRSFWSWLGLQYQVGGTTGEGVWRMIAWEFVFIILSPTCVRLKVEDALQIHRVASLFSAFWFYIIPVALTYLWNPVSIAFIWRDRLMITYEVFKQIFN